MKIGDPEWRELEASIERYLLERACWVPASEISSRFGIRERALRALEDKPGLCTFIAVSGDQGYKHIFLASSEEWDRYAGRESKIHSSALDHLRRKTELRHNATRTSSRPPVQFEKDSGQAVMPLVLSIGVA